jgi:hypothetical protein
VHKYDIEYSVRSRLIYEPESLTGHGPIQKKRKNGKKLEKIEKKERKKKGQFG